MLSQRYKLDRKIFSLIFERGTIVHGEHIMLRFLGGFNETRVSIVVPKKVEKSAVGRHLLKRQGYAIIRGLISHIVQGAGIIVILKQKKEPLSFDVYRKELAELLHEARLLS